MENNVLCLSISLAVQAVIVSSLIATCLMHPVVLIPCCSFQYK